MRIYVASSWRNAQQPEVVEALRAAGHEVYDFRHPKPGNDGFAWSAISPEWRSWNAEQFMAALKHPVAEAGYALDFEAMEWADVFVLVHPSGRSAHLEAGWATGARKPVYVLLEEHGEPELMLKLVEKDGGGLFRDLPTLVGALDSAGTGAISTKTLATISGLLEAAHTLARLAVCNITKPNGRLVQLVREAHSLLEDSKAAKL